MFTALLKNDLPEILETIEIYIPGLMAQAKIHWDQENYQLAESLFRRSIEFCSDNETWRLNVAHVLFMQESKYKVFEGLLERKQFHFMNQLFKNR